MAKKRFRTPGPREHIQAATAAAVAALGYEQTSIQAICAIAEVSPEVFAEQFPGKREAVISAVEEIFDQAMPDCRAEFAAAATWPEGVWAAVRALTDWCASEPAFAKLGLIEMGKAGPCATELADSTMDALCIFLAPGYRLARKGSIPPGSLDATISTQMCSIVREHLLHHPPQTLPRIVPELVRTALAPFLGPQAAERFIAQQLAKEQE